MKKIHIYLLTVVALITSTTTNGQAVYKSVSQVPNSISFEVSHEDYIARRATSKKPNNKAGVVDGVADFQFALYNLHGGSSAFTLQYYSPIMPDSTTSVEYSGGTVIKSQHHASGVIFDPTEPLLGDGSNNLPFGDSDIVNVDTIFIDGVYLLCDPSDTNDSLIVTVLIGDPADSLNPFTFASLPPSFTSFNDTILFTSIDYEGSPSNGVHNGLKGPITARYGYKFSAAEAGSLQSFAIPTPGLQIPPGNIMGVFVEYIPTPGGWAPGNTANLVSNSGDFNVFRQLTLMENVQSFLSLSHLDVPNPSYQNSSIIKSVRTRYDPSDTLVYFIYGLNSVWFHVSGTSTGIDTTAVPNCNLTADFTIQDNGNGNYTFTNTSTGNFNQQHWSFGDGISSSLSPNHTFSTNGDFAIVLTVRDSNDGCFDTNAKLISVSGVANPDSCKVGFGIYPDERTGIISILLSSVGNNLSYLWDFGDGDYSFDQYPTHTYADEGPYYLCVNIDDGNGCTDTFCDSIGINGVVFDKSNGFTIETRPAITASSNSEAVLKSVINIYPNPTSNQLIIDNHHYTINEIKITDLTGKVLKTVNNNFNIIDVNELSSGIYFIEVITNEGEILIQKFMKE